MPKIFSYAGMVALFFFYQTVYSQLTVATAANMKYAMEELRTDFSGANKIGVKAVYGSSGKLVTQIKNGAPFDLFVSADVGYADSAVKWGYGASKPKIYAYGKLALWTMKNFDLTKGLSVLADSAPASTSAPSGGSVDSLIPGKTRSTW